MKNIVLTGMMGCGKSTCGALLAEALQRPLLDTDALVEQQAGMSISAIFETQGEAAMRDIETEICRKLSLGSDLVIATGGGLPLRQENRELLRAGGIVIFLRRDPGEIYDTMDRSGRPLAQGGREAFLRRYAQREPIYRDFAHLIAEDFSSPANTIREIRTKLEAYL